MDAIRAASQDACRLFCQSLQELLSSIWWRPMEPILWENHQTHSFEFAPQWSALNPTAFLTSMMEVLYSEQPTYEAVYTQFDKSWILLLRHWKELNNVLTWSSLVNEPQVPVVWKFPQFIQLTQQFADAMDAFHQFIYHSMYPDLDEQSAEGLLDIISKINGKVMMFKRYFQKAGWEESTPRDVLDRIRPDVKAVLLHRLK